MSLQFVLGRAGSGKTHTCLEAIRTRLREDPNGPPVIYLVPEQMTFQSEYALVSTPDVTGMIRAQVYSFSRLAWRVLQEEGGMARRHIDRVGLNMLLRRIIERRKDDLKVFRQVSDQNGFYERLEEMVTEFKRYCVSPDDLQLQEAFVPSAGNQRMRDKLNDLAIVYEELDTFLSRHYVMSEDYLQLLADTIPHSRELKDAEIFIDGFYNFTPQELRVLAALLETCPGVTVTLTLEGPVDGEPPHELDLFYSTARTYQQVKEIAEEAGVEVRSPRVLTSRPRFEQPALAHLEAHYDSRPAVQSRETEGIELVPAVHRRAEVEDMAREILRLVREEGYRWRDMAVLVRNMNGYHDLLQTVFADYGIPVFIDQKRSMLHHPVIELIRSALDVILYNWPYEAMFRCIKTDLIFPPDADEPIPRLREEMDVLENYVLAHGIRGSRWKDGTPWPYRAFVSLEEEGSASPGAYEKEREQKINRLRDMVVPPLKTLERELSGSQDVRGRAEAVYRLLERLQVPQKLQSWRDQAEAAGDLEQAREHDQVWGAVTDWLDQMVEMMGDEPLSLTLFTKVTETGLESLQFSLVPPAMDQVLVGSPERTRLSGVKCAFIVGINDGEFPAKPVEDGILTEEERERLQLQGLELAPGSRRQLLDESFLIYLALSSASNYLRLSWPLADEEGHSLVPSVLVNRVNDLFPELEERFLFNDPKQEPDRERLYVTRPEKTLSSLAVQLRQWIKGYPVSALWWDVYNWFAEDEVWSQKMRDVLNGLFYRNEAGPLSPEISRHLYGEAIRTSVSRMERYQACPFSQFMSHGLRLKERQIFRLEAPDIGQLFHAALKMMDDELRRLQRQWDGLTREDCRALAGKAVNALAPKIQNEILFSSNRYAYIKRKLQQVVERTSLILHEHAKASDFAPLGMEVAFGPDAPLPPLRFTLPNGSTMEVVGRIDRVDRAKGDEGLFLRVIDFKSSATPLNLSEVYFGLSLQMLTYLDVILSFSDRWIGEPASPAGVLYFHVHNPMLNKKQAVSREELERELFKQFKMKGLVLAEEDAVRLMDQQLETGYSDMIPVALKKNSEFYSSSSVAGRDDFDALRRYTRKLIEGIGRDITDGVIDITPYKMKEKIPCRFCSYASVCQFDPSLEENAYRLLSPEKDDAMLERIRREGGEAHDDTDSETGRESLDG